MKWFDTKEIRDEASLTPEQTEYLRRSSITIFGPFNILVRQHWDLLLALIGISALLGALSTYVMAAVIPPEALKSFLAGEPNKDIALIFLGMRLPEYAANLLVFGFGFRHARRLGWNRGRWESFEAFKKSEETWVPWGWLGLILLILGVLHTLYFSVILQFFPGFLSAFGA